MTEQRGQRILLRNTPGITEVERLTRQHNWTLSRDNQHGGIHEMTWDVDSTDLQFHYVEEARSESCFVQFTGTDHRSVEDLSRIAKETLETETVVELAAAADLTTEPREKQRAILRVGLAAPNTFEPYAYSCINAALHDSDSGVRASAIAAAAYTDWPEFTPLVDFLAETDPDENVRRDAAILLEVSEHGKASP